MNLSEIKVKKKKKKNQSYTKDKMFKTSILFLVKTKPDAYYIPLKTEHHIITGHCLVLFTLWNSISFAFDLEYTTQMWRVNKQVCTIRHADCTDLEMKIRYSLLCTVYLAKY